LALQEMPRGDDHLRPRLFVRQLGPEGGELGLRCLVRVRLRVRVKVRVRVAPKP